MIRGFAGLVFAALVWGCGPGEEEPPEDDGELAVGDPCLVNDGCPSPLFCEVDGCLDSAQGTCIETANLDCSEEVESPVCGCDGETYANRCEAHKKRRNIQVNRACDS